MHPRHALALTAAAVGAGALFILALPHAAPPAGLGPRAVAPLAGRPVSLSPPGLAPAACGVSLTASPAGAAEAATPSAIASGTAVATPTADEAPPGPPVVLRAAEVAARVNGVPVTGRDVAPFAPGDSAERSMSPDMLSFLLNRAIEREVVFQVSGARGLELSAEQRAEVERFAASLRPGPDVIAPATIGREQAEFEIRNAEGLILQRALANRAGLPSPYPSEADVRRRYEESPEMFPALPGDPRERVRAWAEISHAIRVEMSGEMRAAHERAMDEFMAGLKSEATIELLR